MVLSEPVCLRGNAQARRVAQGTTTLLTGSVPTIIASQTGLVNSKEDRPLKDRRIVITRPEDQAQDFARLLADLGAEPVAFPTIRIVPPEDWGEVDKALSHIESYDSLIFTSVNGVTYFIERFKKKRADIGILKNLKICTIGPQTAAAIKELGLSVSLIPDEFRAESVVHALEADGIRGKRFLLPRAEKAREILPEEIRKKGGHIDVATAYRTVKGSGDSEKLKGLFQSRAIDAVTFTSSSTVRNFADLFPGNNIEALLHGCVIAHIGPITAQTASDFGIRTDVMPQSYTIQGLTDALVDYFKAVSKRG